MKHPKHEHDGVPILNMNMKMYYEVIKHLINFNQVMPNPATTLRLAFSLSSCVPRMQLVEFTDHYSFVCCACM